MVLLMYLVCKSGLRFCILAPKVPFLEHQPDHSTNRLTPSPKHHAPSKNPDHFDHPHHPDHYDQTGPDPDNEIAQNDNLQ